MQLVLPLDKHIIEMMNWFSSEQELNDWGGPNVRYPLILSSFLEDLKLTDLKSFVLVSDQAECLAFGQYYRRLNKCHLSRLITHPKFRGRGIVSELMCRLCALGAKELNVSEYSLFVLAHNTTAINAYKKFGFVFESYPHKVPLENCLYMIKS